jgi:hypothetical protein
MADTRCQQECERWVRDVWLPSQLGLSFTERNVRLVTGGQFRFDAVSTDGSVVASTSTSRAKMSSGKSGVVKMMKLRSDMLFLTLVVASKKLLIFTEECMYRACSAENERGRTPRDINFLLAPLPQVLVEKLIAARLISSAEVRPNRAPVQA